MGEQAVGGDENPFIANSIYPDVEKIFGFQPKSISSIKDNCLIVLDTNALLVPYTIGKDSLDQIETTFSSLITSKRLFIPGQVAREFASNRTVRLSELFQQFSRKRNIEPVQKGMYPLLEGLTEYQELIGIEKEFDALITRYQASVQKILGHIRDWNWDDPVSQLYNRLFNKDVFVDLQFDPAQVTQELARRQKHKIPPGYKDSGKEINAAGDLLIWLTILELAKRQEDLIFVSGDIKPDWWHQSEKQPLYPRFELVEEYRRHSNDKSFHILRFSAFLSLFGASQNVVSEIKKEEESLIFNFTSARAIVKDANHAYAEIGVLSYLRKEYLGATIMRGEGFLDFVVETPEGSKTGVKIYFVQDNIRATLNERRSRSRDFSELSHSNLNKTIHFYVATDVSSAMHLHGMFANVFERDDAVERRIGYIAADGNFTPLGSLF